MEKLEYDSLYKFLVSLGITLMILPFAALVYLFSIEPIIISQIEYDALSEYSLLLIENRNTLSTWFAKFLLIGGSLMLSSGSVITVIGLLKWNQNQKKLDMILDGDATEKRLTLLEMTNKEVDAKTEKEIKEAVEDSNGEKVNKSERTAFEIQYLAMTKYKEIEDYCFKYIVMKYGKDYNFKRNIRMGKYDYDIIGVSQRNRTDVLIEVKYWKSLSIVNKNLYATCAQLHGAGENYEMLTQRKYNDWVVVVIPDEQYERINDVIDRYLMGNLDDQYIPSLVLCVRESDIK